MYCKDFKELVGLVESLRVEQEEQLMLFVADQSSQHLDKLRLYLNEKNIRYFGGIYASLLVGSSNINTGFIVKKVKPVYSALVLPFMMRVKSLPDPLESATAIVLVDGLSERMKDLMDTVYDNLGKKVKYVGGGAGFYNLSHQPCIFNNDGVYKDVAYVCIVQADSFIAVEHGWNKLEGPFFVKKSMDNVLSRLDDDTAFEIYKHVIEEEERITLFKEDFFIYAKDHPFGIEQPDGTVIVRDPIALKENMDIVCVANIPTGSDVYVLKGDAQTLLASSLEIARICRQNAPAQYTPLLFDCISRAMFLEDAFEIELDNIQKHLKYDVEGALSIGEIASKSDGELVIHNKSTILGLIYD